MIELIDSEYKLFFTQTYWNSKLSSKIKQNFDMLLEQFPQLNDMDCYVKKEYNNGEITITNTYIIEKPLTNIEFHKFNNLYTQNKMLALYIIIPMIIAVAVNSLIALIISYITLLPIVYYAEKSFIEKSFTPKFKKKYRLNISDDAYKFLASQLFRRDLPYASYYQRMINKNVIMRMYCEYNIDNDIKQSTEIYKGCDKKMILEFEICGCDNLKYCQQMLKRIDGLLELYKKDIATIKCNNKVVK